MNPPRVLLIGMMGAGKTTVGRALAARTGWPYLDNDELVRRVTGEDAPEVLDEQGVAELRRVESAALTEALRTDPPVVAGVAGGVVDDDTDRARLRAGGFVVWLRAPLPLLARRVGNGAGRAWLGDDPLAALQRLYAGRESRYLEAASLVVDVADLTPEQVAERVLAALTRR